MRERPCLDELFGDNRHDTGDALLKSRIPIYLNQISSWQGRVPNRVAATRSWRSRNSCSEEIACLERNLVALALIALLVSCIPTRSEDKSRHPDDTHHKSDYREKSEHDKDKPADFRIRNHDIAEQSCKENAKIVEHAISMNPE
jgi:hypothetical protein